jgi:GTPase SAR1 family protein
MDKSTSSLKKVVNKTVIILGDSKVGKTSFIRRYVENTFKENYYETLGNITINIFKALILNFSA